MHWRVQHKSLLYVIEELFKSPSDEEIVVTMEFVLILAYIYMA